MSGSRKIFLNSFICILALFFLLPFPEARAQNDQSPEDSDNEEQPSGVIIRNNEINDNPIAIYVGHRWGKVFVDNNVIEDNGEAIRWIMSRDAGQITNNTILNNLVGVKIQDTYSSNTEGIIKFPNMAVEDILIQGNKIYENLEGNIVNTTGKDPILTGNYWQEGQFSKTPSEKSGSEEKEKSQENDQEEEAGSAGNAGKLQEVTPETEETDQKESTKPTQEVSESAPDQEEDVSSEESTVSPEDETKETEAKEPPKSTEETTESPSEKEEEVKKEPTDTESSVSEKTPETETPSSKTPEASAEDNYENNPIPWIVGGVVGLLSLLLLLT
ncbi:right-handed parallel beta-helix repeat-containing protein [Candidatus Bipolaricaulota bacterium]|nr:right-handed parallel beta-helix repeat-containing protein [Candidatus Bipolaricaulota bacterium]